MLPFISTLVISLLGTFTGNFPISPTFVDKAVQMEPPPSRVWDIPELLSMIVDELPHNDLLTMARVCSAFWGLVVPIIWRTIPRDLDMGFNTFLAFLNILPPELQDALRSNDEAKVKHVLSHVTLEWTRFKIYTPLIKHLSIPFNDVDQDPSPILQFLQSQVASPICPKLEVLDICIENAAPSAATLQCLLTGCTTLRQFAIHLQGSSPKTPAIPAIMDIISTSHSLRLESLTFTTWSPGFVSLPLLLALSHAIVAQPGLRRLQIRDLANSFTLPFQAASELQHLERISFNGEWEDYWDSKEYWMSSNVTTPVTEIHGFPALRSAAMAMTADAIPRALAAIKSAHLTELEIVVESPYNEEEEESLTSTSSLAGGLDDVRRFTSLSYVQILFLATSAAWSDFSPLLDCACLEFVSLYGHDLSQLLRDEELFLMAQSWPQLRELDLIDTLSDIPDAGSTPPAATLRGLDCLAAHCVHLRKLTISVDARNPDPDSLPPVVGTSMVDVRLAYSWVASGEESEMALVNFITNMWPNQIILGEPMSREKWVRTRWDIGRVGGWDRVRLGRMQVGPWPRIWGLVHIGLA